MNKKPHGSIISSWAPRQEQVLIIEAVFYGLQILNTMYTYTLAVEQKCYEKECVRIIYDTHIPQELL